MRARLEGPTQEMFRWVSPETSLGPRIILGNPWLFGPLERAELSRSPPTNAIIRTTGAPTMLSASDKANVLARRASAVVNYRLLPGASLQDVLAHVRAVFPEAVVTPPLVVPATDAGHYGILSDDVYRLLPIAVTAEDLDRFHGIDERIAVKGYAHAIGFYAEVMRRAASKQTGVSE